MGRISRTEDNLFPFPKGAFIVNGRYEKENQSIYHIMIQTISVKNKLISIDLIMVFFHTLITVIITLRMIQQRNMQILPIKRGLW